MSIEGCTEARQSSARGTAPPAHDPQFVQVEGRLLDSALRYACTWGWYVLPLWWPSQDGSCACGKADCDAPGKHPIGALVPRGVLDASKDSDVIRAWWAEYPNANVGVATGHPSSIIVLDLDCHRDGANGIGWFEDLISQDQERAGDLSGTPQATTGGGGKHFYFEYPPGCHLSTRTVAPGVDLRGDRAYVVAPPSRHHSGRDYQWAQDDGTPSDIHLAEVPAWLFTVLQARAISVAHTTPAKILRGQRNITLTSLAGSMRRHGMTAEEIETALLRVNQRCDPPLASPEIERIARSVGRYQPGGRGEQESNRLPFALLRDALAQVPDEPEWFWEGYLAPGVITLLAGWPKVGKSTLVFGILGAISAGQPFLEADTRQAKALLLSEEHEGLVKEKIRNDHLLDTVYFLARYQAYGCNWGDIVRQAVEYCSEQSAEILIVDTFAEWVGFTGDEENSSGEVLAALRPLKEYAAPAGLAVLLVTHQRKSGGEHGAAVRGSNAFTGAVDVVLEFEPPHGAFGDNEYTRVLKAHSRFRATPASIVVSLRNGHYETLGKFGVAAAEAERQRILDAMLDCDDNVTIEQLAEHLELAKPTVSRRLRDLHERSRVCRSGKGVRGDPYRWGPTIVFNERSASLATGPKLWIPLTSQPGIQPFRHGTGQEAVRQ